jgi:hypothetical protein
LATHSGLCHRKRWVAGTPQRFIYLADFWRNQKSQVSDFVGFQSNCFHVLNSL